MAEKIHGVLTPTLVPLDSRGEINEAEMRRFYGWLIDKGVHGLYPNGSTGEFTRFTVEERKRIVKITCEVANGRVPVLAGAAEANVKETLAACEAYHSYGARAVAIVSPFYFRLSQESVYAYFAEIAKNSPIDVTLYNIPMFATPLEVNTIRRLAEFPRVVGIKDSTGDLSFMMRMISTVKPDRPDFCFLTGWEAVLAPMMLIGCDGGTHATSNVIPEVTKQLYEMCRAGQYTDAMKIQFRVLELFDTMLFNFEFPDGFRAAADLRGFNLGRGRQPMSSTQQVDRSALQKVLQCILADFGVVGSPDAGCPPRSGNASNDKVAQIVFEVLHELERRGIV